MSFFRDYDKEAEDAFISFYDDLIDNGLGGRRPNGFGNHALTNFPDDFYDELQDFIKVSNVREWYIDNDASTVNRIYRTDKDGNRYFVKRSQSDLQDAIEHIIKVGDEEYEAGRMSYEDLEEFTNKSFSILFTDDANHKEFIDWYVEQVEVPERYWEQY